MHKKRLLRCAALLVAFNIAIPPANAYRPGDIGRAVDWAGRQVRSYRPGDMNRMAIDLGNQVRRAREGQYVPISYQPNSTRIRSAAKQVIKRQARKQRRASYARRFRR